MGKIFKNNNNNNNKYMFNSFHSRKIRELEEMVRNLERYLIEEIKTQNDNWITIRKDIINIVDKLPQTKTKKVCKTKK